MYLHTQMPGLIMYCPSYRIPFAIQWIWPVPIIVGVLLAPESPW